jgi:hypothetical protein
VKSFLLVGSVLKSYLELPGRPLLHLLMQLLLDSWMRVTCMRLLFWFGFVGGGLICLTKMTVMRCRNAGSRIWTPYVYARSLWKIHQGSRISSNTYEEGRLSVLIALTNLQTTGDKGTPHEGQERHLETERLRLWDLWWIPFFP